MRFSPKSSEDWGKLSFLPFRIFVFAAFIAEYLMEALWPRHGGSPPMWVVLITLGYVVSFVVFIFGGIGGLVYHKAEAVLWHFIFAMLAFAFGVYSLRFLASA